MLYGINIPVKSCRGHVKSEKRGSFLPHSSLGTKNIWLYIYTKKFEHVKQLVNGSTIETHILLKMFI